MMIVAGARMRNVAEAVAMSHEPKGLVQVDVLDGYLNVRYEKGADVEVEHETGACNVSGAWCNIVMMEYVDADEYKEKVQCDTEMLENMVSELMNN